MALHDSDVNINATPSVCGTLSSWWPEYIIVVPSTSFMSPDEVHGVSLSPRIDILHVLISFPVTVAQPWWEHSSHLPRTWQEIMLPLERKQLSAVGSWHLPYAASYAVCVTNASSPCQWYLWNWSMPMQLHQSPVGQHYRFPPLTTRTWSWRIVEN